MKYHSKLFPKIKKGQVAEKIAELFLLKKGYFVFKNEFGLGPIDLIEVKYNLMMLNQLVLDLKIVSLDQELK